MNEAIPHGPEIAAAAALLPQISVVVPTFNERDNVTTLYKRLEAAFGATPWASRSPGRHVHKPRSPTPSAAS